MITKPSIIKKMFKSAGLKMGLTEPKEMIEVYFGGIGDDDGPTTKNEAKDTVEKYGCTMVHYEEGQESSAVLIEGTAKNLSLFMVWYEGSEDYSYYLRGK